LPALPQAITPSLAVQAGAQAAGRPSLASALEARPATAAIRREAPEAQATSPVSQLQVSAMANSSGRPRKLTDRQVRIILDWHERFLAWEAQRITLKSQRQLARELGVSQGTVSRAVRLSGHYKQGSPESRIARVPSDRGRK
jgi:hypothetical protein